MSATTTTTTTTTAPATPAKTLTPFVLSFAGVYLASKELYALYMPVVAATMIATYATMLLNALPKKVSALESLESLDAFLTSFFASADTKTAELKGKAMTKAEAVKGDVNAKIDEVKGKIEDVKGKAIELKGQVVDTTTAKIEATKATIETVKGKAIETVETGKTMALELKGEIEKDGIVTVAKAKGEEVKEIVNTKVDEAKTIAAAKIEEVKAKAVETKDFAENKVQEARVATAKKVEQTKVVAEKVKIVAVDAAVDLKSSIEKEGLVTVATKAGEIAKEQGVAAIEVVKAEGVKTLVTNVTSAVVEKINDVEVPAVTKPEPAIVSAPAPAPVAVPASDQQ